MGAFTRTSMGNLRSSTFECLRKESPLRFEVYRRDGDGLEERPLLGGSMAERLEKTSEERRSYRPIYTKDLRTLSRSDDPDSLLLHTLFLLSFDDRDPDRETVADWWRFLRLLDNYAIKRRYAVVLSPELMELYEAETARRESWWGRLRWGRF